MHRPWRVTRPVPLVNDPSYAHASRTESHGRRKPALLPQAHQHAEAVPISRTDTRNPDPPPRTEFGLYAPAGSVRKAIPPAKNSPQNTMPSTTKIDDYVVFYSTNAFAPRIGLQSAGKLIGQLNFEPNAAKLPLDGLKDGVPNLFYRQQDFANVIDVLRNEKPVYLYYNGAGTGFENGIRTMEKVPATTKAPALSPAAAAAVRPRQAR
jgi:hypothetical protein